MCRMLSRKEKAPFPHRFSPQNVDCLGRSRPVHEEHEQRPHCRAARKPPPRVDLCKRQRGSRCSENDANVEPSRHPIQFVSLWSAKSVSMGFLFLCRLQAVVARGGGRGNCTEIEVLLHPGDVCIGDIGLIQVLDEKGLTSPGVVFVSSSFGAESADVRGCEGIRRRNEEEKTYEAQIGENVYVELEYQPLVFLCRAWLVPVVPPSSSDRLLVHVHDGMSCAGRC